MEDEQWRPVVGYPDYQVSDHGRVRSLKWGKCKLLKPWVDRGGYLSVTLRQDGEKASGKVHQLVLQAFVGPCPKGMECLHGPLGKLCNKLSNLKWGSRSQNWRDRLRDGAVYSSRFNGVDRNHRRKWRAKIEVEGKAKYLGYFHCELEAALAFDRYVIEHGLARVLNFPERLQEAS